MLFFSLNQEFSAGGKFYLSWGKFNDAVVHFSTALMSKQRTGSKFYVRKLAWGKRKNKV